jgi:hypothetical protein
LLRQAQLEGLTNMLGLGASAGQQQQQSATSSLLDQLIGGIGGLFSGGSSENTFDTDQFISNVTGGGNAFSDLIDFGQFLQPSTEVNPITLESFTSGIGQQQPTYTLSGVNLPPTGP